MIGIPRNNFVSLIKVNMFSKIWAFILNLFRSKKPSTTEQVQMLPLTQSDWQILSDGSGQVSFNNGSVHLIPKAATLQEYGLNNEYGAWIINRQMCRNFRADMEVNNLKQLRENLPPRNYECFWFFFNYIPEPNLRKKTNYFIHKTNTGLEIGKAFDTHDQTFIETPNYEPLKLNQWYHYTIIKRNQQLEIYINGTQVFKKNLNTNPVYRRLYDESGYVGLYTEDAHVKVKGFQLQIFN